MSPESTRKGPLRTLALPFVIVTVAVLISFRDAPSLGFVDYDDPVAVLDPHLRGMVTTRREAGFA